MISTSKLPDGHRDMRTHKHMRESAAQHIAN